MRGERRTSRGGVSRAERLQARAHIVHSLIQCRDVTLAWCDYLVPFHEPAAPTGRSACAQCLFVHLAAQVRIQCKLLHIVLTSVGPGWAMFCRNLQSSDNIFTGAYVKARQWRRADLPRARNASTRTTCMARTHPSSICCALLCGRPCTAAAAAACASPASASPCVCADGAAGLNGSCACGCSAGPDDMVYGASAVLAVIKYCG